MNQAQKSAVRKIPRPSSEFSILTNYCSHRVETDNSTDKKTGKWDEFREFLMKVGHRLLCVCVTKNHFSLLLL